ncbi:MAG: hypothetical protein ACON38_20040 [Akkermansiaceae bacterium]
MQNVSSEGSRSSSVLKALYSISDEELREDFESLNDQAIQLRIDEKKFRRLSESQVSDKDLARSYHRRLLLGCHMEEFSKLPKELILFSVTLPAFEIAEMACGVSCERGELLKLGQVVMGCEESGIFDGYDSAVAKSDAILTKIHDTMFVNVLERYGHAEIVRLFETKRPLFELKIEVGRRLVSPHSIEKEEALKIEADFREKFGPEFVTELNRRLEQHDLVAG